MKVASAFKGIDFFAREVNSIFKCYLKVLCIETSISLGSLQNFEGAVGEFKGALVPPTNFWALQTLYILKKSS